MWSDRHAVREIWTGDPEICFRALLSDEEANEHLGPVASGVRESEQAELRDPIWE